MIKESNFSLMFTKQLHLCYSLDPNKAWRERRKEREREKREGMCWFSHLTDEKTAACEKATWLGCRSKGRGEQQTHL